MKKMKQSSSIFMVLQADFRWGRISTRIQLPMMTIRQVLRLVQILQVVMKRLIHTLTSIYQKEQGKPLQLIGR